MSLILFDFEDTTVRFVGTPEKLEWVAQDVCDVLGIKNVSQALSRLDEDEKGITTNDTLGGQQNLLTVFEPGLYSLIFTSRKPVAKRFKRWVFHEVLPRVRTDGGYISPNATSEQLQALEKRILALQGQVKEEQRLRAFAEEEERLAVKAAAQMYNRLAAKQG